MKILFLTNGYPTVSDPFLCPFIRRQKEDLERLEDLRVEVFHFTHIFEKLPYLRAILEIFRRGKNYDVIHCHHGLSLFVVIFGLLFTIRSRPKIVISFLNNIELEYTELGAFGNQFLAKLTFLIVKNFRITIIEKNNVFKRNFDDYHVLPNGVQTSKYNTVFQSKKKRKVNENRKTLRIIYVSSKNKNRKQKRFDRFESVIKFLIAHNIDHEYKILSNVPYDEMMTSYEWADLIINTSDFEGSPNAIKESVACGVISYSLDVGDIRSIINGSSLSKIFDNELLLADSICKNFVDLILSVEDPKLIINNGYDSTQVARRLKSIYEKAVYR